MITCIDAVRNVFEENAGVVLTTEQVRSAIYGKYPDEPWKPGTISAHLIGLSVNHASSKHYPTMCKQAFLYSLGNGRYRLWDINRDGVADPTQEEESIIGGEAMGDPKVSQVESTLASTALSLERDLERCLLNKLDQVEAGLTLASEDTAFPAQQLDTRMVGRLDLLARDLNRQFVVIELKAGLADEKAIGQLLRYMGWVKLNLAAGVEVRGIIVANDFSEALLCAVAATNNIRLKRYEVRFEFSDVAPITHAL